MEAAPPPGNADIARALREIALFLEMDDIPFKPRAYEKAARVVESLDRPLARIHAAEGTAGIRALPAIGEGIAKKIAEYLATGRIRALEEMRAKRPVDVLSLTRIEGLGPKTVRALQEELGVKDLATLEAACAAGRVRRLPRFGEKGERKILKGLAFLKQSAGRRSLGDALPLARTILDRLRNRKDVARVEIAGSLRRGKETIGDLDFLAVSRRPAAVAAFFAGMPETAHVYAKGDAKVLVRLAGGIDADLRIVPAESFGAAFAYFTGSKDHNVALRARALEKGLKLNEYGVFRGQRRVAGRTEEEVYKALDLPWIPPELRENAGEIEAAAAGRLPNLVAPEDIRGDLQVQTDWTDGAASIEEMAAAARREGFSYIAITDHTRDLAMARGNDERRLAEQIDTIRRAQRRFKDIRILSGAEVNIRKDGSLDIDAAILARLDVVGAAIHSHFDQPSAEITRRAIRAIENPHVDIFFHPTARHLGKREPAALDMDAVIAAARRAGTALEVNAHPARLDLKDEHVRKAIAAGVKLVINSDAHHPAHFTYVRTFGAFLARRGWAERKDVLNTLPVEGLLKALKGGREAQGHPRRV